MVTMDNKTGSALGIALTIVAFIIGVFGIAILIGVGEAANNGIVAFAAVSFPFALLAGLLAWTSPRAQWAIALAISAPVALLSCIGSWSGAYLILGAIWTILLSCAGAYAGASLRLSKTGTPPPDEGKDSNS